MKNLDLGSTGCRGDIFVRDGEKGPRIFKVQPEIIDSLHRITLELEALLALGFGQEAVDSIIATTYLQLERPSRP